MPLACGLDPAVLHPKPDELAITQPIVSGAPDLPMRLKPLRSVLKALLLLALKKRHGSQFAPDGTALNGPAFAPLNDYKEG